jgi:hypothetical protein
VGDMSYYYIAPRIFIDTRGKQFYKYISYLCLLYAYSLLGFQEGPEGCY